MPYRENVKAVEPERTKTQAWVDELDVLTEQLVDSVRNADRIDRYYAWANIVNMVIRFGTEIALHDPNSAPAMLGVARAVEAIERLQDQKYNDDSESDDQDSE